MSSDVDICNRALSRLGQKGIEVLDQDSPEARACNLHYLPEQNGMLEEHDWSFGMARVVLAEVTNDRPKEWRHAYQYPDNCHTMIALIDADIGRIDPPSDYRVEGQTIYSHIEVAHAVYIGASDNVGEWSELARTALSWRVQAAIAMSLTEDGRRLEQASRGAETAFSKALAHDLRERSQWHTYSRMSPAILARFDLDVPGWWQAQPILAVSR